MELGHVTPLFTTPSVAPPEVSCYGSSMVTPPILPPPHTATPTMPMHKEGLSSRSAQETPSSGLGTADSVAIRGFNPDLAHLLRGALQAI